MKFLSEFSSFTQKRNKGDGVSNKIPSMGQNNHQLINSLVSQFCSFLDESSKIDIKLQSYMYHRW